ncbi:MAG: DUF362 domain-containing protein [Deltaproteobacteria bacterium]|nr:DUF362 domain-containing protein [Deltaproteobacteria bacterium]
MSTVYFMDLRTTYQNNLITKLERLITAAGLDRIVSPRDQTAVKLHFGEPGNVAYIRPVFLRGIVSAIKRLGAVPFLTDTNTLYVGRRSTSATHISAAIENGFAYSVTQAPIIIADGLRGANEVSVPIDGKHFKSTQIAADIVNADALVAVTHFKGHPLSGFGGSLKNIGMGCASRKGKLSQHSDISPKVKRKKCIGCGTCVDHCSAKAITLESEKARIDPEICIGCGQCIITCPNEAIRVQWNSSMMLFQEKMAEYAAGALQNKTGKAFFITFITQVSPNCDCLPTNDAPIVRDIGILAGTDPVAMDQAAIDLVNQEPGLAGSCLTSHLAPGEDKIAGIYPKVDWQIQLDHAQFLGIGSRSYTLETI